MNIDSTRILSLQLCSKERDPHRPVAGGLADVGFDNGHEEHRMSTAAFLFTGSSSLYRARTTSMRTICSVMALTMLGRSSDSESMMFLAVVATSPGTTRTRGTCTTPRTPRGNERRHRT